MNNETQKRPESAAGSGEASELSGLLCCPLCGGDTAWCGEHDKDDIHECHFIVCVGECKTQFDTVADDTAAETIEDLRIIAAKKFNIRAT